MGATRAEKTNDANVMMSVDGSDQPLSLFPTVNERERERERER